MNDKPTTCAGIKEALAYIYKQDDDITDDIRRINALDTDTSVDDIQLRDNV